MDKRHVPVSPPGGLSWILLLLLMILTGGSLFVAAGLPSHPPQTPSTPLLGYLCDRIDCGFSSAGSSTLLRDIRLSGLVMRPGNQQDTLVFSAVIVNTASRPQSWPMLTFELFDASGKFLQVRRLEARDYAPRGTIPVNTPLTLQIKLVEVPAGTSLYSVIPALSSMGEAAAQ